MDKKTYMSRFERQQNIHEKGFNMANEKVFADNKIVDYSRVKIGNGQKKMDDVSVNLRTALNQMDSTYTDKSAILSAIQNKELSTLREISDFYFDISGIYKRGCEYIAFLNRYDYYVTPYSKYNKKQNKNKILSQFYEILEFLDKSNLKKKFSEISLEVIKHGCYYGYKIDSKDQIILQDLPADYCRSKYFIDDRPAVEFNMKFFDDKFRDSTYRQKILNIFPKEFNVGYQMYKNGLLPPETSGEENSWYLLNPKNAVKFNLNNSDIPYLIDAVPAIIDLEEAKEIDRKKMIQQLMKIIIQKLPIDKNGDLVFDVDEAKDLHANAVAMLKNVLGADVLTTFAEIKVEDMDTTSTVSANADSLEKVERAVYDQFGFSKNIFNTDGNLSLEKSICDDEASVKSFNSQFEDFINNLCLNDFSDKNVYYKVKILETTIYNYKEMAKLYKEQIQLGYSKLLPQLALGHSQSEILAELTFENEILDLSSIMIPAQMSSTMSSNDLGNLKKDKSNNKQNNIEDKTPGRKELPDDQKSEKTIANRESMA